VPSGVAVLEPEPLTEGDEAVLAHMNEVLGPSDSGNQEAEYGSSQPDDKLAADRKAEADRRSGDDPDGTGTDAPQDA
jgi:hypothetical protein